MTGLHATSGTARRPGHAVGGNGLVFQVTDEMRSLALDLDKASGGRSGKTLAKVEGLRVTLVVIDAGVSLEPEAVAGGASLHVLDGRVTVQCDGERCELGPGELIVLGRNLREPVQAIERSTFLLTVAWPEGAGAWRQEATSGHL